MGDAIPSAPQVEADVHVGFLRTVQEIEITKVSFRRRDAAAVQSHQVEAEAHVSFLRVVQQVEVAELRLRRHAR